MEGSSVSPDVRSPPTWITKDFIQATIRKARNDNLLIVTDCSVSFASPFGQNYTSEILRLSVRMKNGNGHEENVSLILKCLSTDGELARITGIHDDYTKETSMISKVLVDVDRLLTSSGEDFEKIGARYYSSGYQPTQYIILEDLSVSGYKISNKNDGLDLKHGLLVMKSIAIYHAATAVLMQMHEELKDEFEVAAMFTPETMAIMRPFCVAVLRFISKEIAHWHESPKDLLERILDQPDIIQNQIRKLTKYRPDKFNVILHGDLWINNLMFKYSQEQVKSVRILDFQKSYVSSPAIDLLYFMYTSLEEDVRTNNMEDLITEYHKHLTNTLKTLNYHSFCYTLQDLKSDISEFQVLNLFTSFYILSLAKVDENDQFNIDGAINNDTNELKKAYNSKYFAALRSRIPMLLELGLI